MPVLAAEVERGEAAAVAQVVVGPGAAEEVGGAAEAVPGGVVQGGVAVLKGMKGNIEVTWFGQKIIKNLHYFFKKLK